jgi:hypothetical protein
MKQVRAVTSAERGSGHHGWALSASGVFIPLFFVFRRKNHVDCFIARGPDGNAGSADKSVLGLAKEQFLKSQPQIHSLTLAVQRPAERQDPRL